MAGGKVSKRPIHQALTPGEGEGVVIGIVRDRSPAGTGIALDFSGAPVPQRRFSADAAWVAFGSDMVRVLFGQFRAAGPELEHVVVLRLPFTAVRFFVDSMKGVSVTAKKPTSMSISEPPAKNP